jgi:dipeptidyl aminopeptidase/acylaminoacyl peptidase
MAYATIFELKSYLAIADGGDDLLLMELLDRASAAIDAYTGRNFAAGYGTRYYNTDAVDKDVLSLDGDLYAATTITNGEGKTITAYWLLPRNVGPPYHQIRLKSASDYSWDFGADGEVEVYGLWGYSREPPDDIIHACIRLAAYYYRQKDAQVFDVTALPEQGIITVPKGMPADVRQLLDRYRKLGVF